MIAQAIAAAVDAADQAVSSCSVCAPLRGGRPLLVVTWAGLDCAAAERGTAGVGISGTHWRKRPDHVVQLPPMADLEATTIDAAWAWGAWDITRTCIGAGHAGALPPYMAPIEDEARAAGYVTWTWRPMLGAPEIRIRAHGRGDASLNALTLGREGPAPEVDIPTLRPGRQHILRLGSPPPQTAPTAHGARRPRLATLRQVRTICALRREAGESDHDTLPRLTIREASDWITRLLRERRASGGAR